MLHTKSCTHRAAAHTETDMPHKQSCCTHRAAHTDRAAVRTETDKQAPLAQLEQVSGLGACLEGEVQGRPGGGTSASSAALRQGRHACLSTDACWKRTGRLRLLLDPPLSAKVLGAALCHMSMPHSRVQGMQTRSFLHRHRRRPLVLPYLRCGAL